MNRSETGLQKIGLHIMIFVQREDRRKVVRQGSSSQEAITPAHRDPASPKPFWGSSGKMKVWFCFLCTSIPTSNAPRMWVVRIQYDAIYPRGVQLYSPARPAQNNDAQSYKWTGGIYTFTAVATPALLKTNSSKWTRNSWIKHYGIFSCSSERRSETTLITNNVWSSFVCLNCWLS